MLFPRPRLQEVSAYLRLHEAEWRALGVSRVRVFGSVARDEAHEASDIDVLIDFSGPAGLTAQVRVIWLFERLLGRRTDVVTPGGLKSALRLAVLADAVDVLAAPVPEGQGTAPKSTGSLKGTGSPKRWRWRVQELLGLLERLHVLTQSHDLASFQADLTAQDAACMNLLRLGEGTKFVPEEVQDAHAEVPWNELRSIRNLLAHDYFGVDVALLWHTLTTELPPLTARLEALLGTVEETA